MLGLAVYPKPVTNTQTTAKPRKSLHELKFITGRKTCAIAPCRADAVHMAGTMTAELT